MARTDSSHSGLFNGNSHIGPNGSKWLEENLQEMDRSVKRMLKLIEEDGDSLTNSADNYCQRKPELIANIEEFHQMYRSLAKNYNHLTKKSCMITMTDLQVHGSGNSEFCSDQDSLLQTPDEKLDFHKSGCGVFSLDTSPSSGTNSSALSLKESVELLSSSSDSESECFNTPAYSRFSTPLNLNGQVLQQKVNELETELPSVQEKLNTREADLELERKRVLELQKHVAELEVHVKDADYKIGILMEELKVTREQLKCSDKEIEKLRDELSEGKSEPAIQLQSQLDVAQEHIARLEALLDLERRQVLDLQERIEIYDADVSDRNQEVKELRVGFYNAQEQYTQEKVQLQSDVLSLSEKNAFLNTKLEESELRRRKLEDKIQLYETEKKELERSLVGQEMALQGGINQLNVELTQKNIHLETLNKEFDRFKVKYDMLVAEKDQLSAKVQMLMANLSSRDDLIREMEECLNQLRKRHEEVISGSAAAQKLENELRLRVKELQKEVDRQRIEISDCAEEKREVIRQLCFSIEHYRNGYKELCQAFTVHRRQAVIVT